MSLVKTLGRVAFSLIVAQASKKLLGGRGGMLGGLLGAVLGGGATRSTAMAGGIAALLTGLLSNKSAQASTNAGTSSGGGVLGSLFNMLGGSSSPAQNTNTKGMGDFVKAALTDEPIQATPEQEKYAGVLLKAMLNAVKADGTIDDNERAKINEHLKDASQAEKDLVMSELTNPLDLQGLIQSVPQGLEKQVYLMSLLALTLDDPREVKYMQDLANGLNISVAERNGIHDQLGIAHLA